MLSLLVMPWPTYQEVLGSIPDPTVSGERRRLIDQRKQQMNKFLNVWEIIGHLQIISYAEKPTGLVRFCEEITFLPSKEI